MTLQVHKLWNVAIWPIYEAMSSYDLLNRYCVGLTQNNNEKFIKNYMAVLSEAIVCDSDIIAIAVFMAILLFSPKAFAKKDINI